MNRFKDPMMRGMYDRMIENARNPNSELYNSRGLRRSGASHRNAFWAGFDGIRPVWVVNGTLGYACWRAGVDFSKEGVE